MFRIWGKIFTQNHLQRDTVVIDDSQRNRTRKVFAALEQVCSEFDLSVPIWLDKNITEFKRVSKTRFTQDNFIDTIDFDYLELHVIEEDDAF
ncbi:MAG: hypothetical protein IKU83_05495 [Lachnospiraceae bacterium]|nr:hypothetical protein [Lachnospiraceae bacterium]